MTAVRVRFVDQTTSILSRLDVEAPNGRDLLGLLLQALFDLRIQVVSCVARVDAPQWSAALSLVEFDGAPIGAKRRAEVQGAVFRLLDATLAALSPPQRVAELFTGTG